MVISGKLFTMKSFRDDFAFDLKLVFAYFRQTPAPGPGLQFDYLSSLYQQVKQLSLLLAARNGADQSGLFTLLDSRHSTE